LSEIKLTKTELRLQQKRLLQLELYLPTLELKKALLQAEVQEIAQEILKLKGEWRKAWEIVEGESLLFSEDLSLSLADFLKIDQLVNRYENIAGVEVPYFEDLLFKEADYHLFDTPVWLDVTLEHLRGLLKEAMKIKVAHERKKALEKELREVSIRVNLFQKILIPRARANIKKIKVFLSDQLLAAVAQTKVAKTKIEAKKNAH